MLSKVKFMSSITKDSLLQLLFLSTKDTKREVVQQCIANLMSQFLNHYDHSEVIADLYTRQFEDKLRHLCPLDKANRLRCFKWREKTRPVFVEHLKLTYPQLSNVLDKTFITMIKDQPIVWSGNPELTKMANHYDSCTTSEELEAVKILMDKVNNPSAGDRSLSRLRWNLTSHCKLIMLMIFDSFYKHPSMKLL